VSEPIRFDEIVISNINTFETLNLPDNSAWEVIYTPEWAGPLKTSGQAGESLQIFVETNDELSERTDTIKVLMGNGENVHFPLRQHGNGMDEGFYITDKDLKVTCGVGYSTNVFENPTGMKYQVKASSPIKFDKLYAALRAAGEDDALYGENLYSSRTESYTGDSSEDISHELSVKAGVEVGISAFKLSVEGAFTQKSSSSTKKVYAIEEVKHVVGDRYLRGGMLRYFAENDGDIFQATFRNMRNKLAQNPDDKTVMKQIIDRYGTHLITRGVLGGELKLGMELTMSDNISNADIHAALELGVKVVSLKGEANLSSKEKAIASNTTISLTSYGGNNVYTIAPGTTFETFQTTVKSYKNLENWVSSIKDGTSLSLIDIETLPIYELMPTEASRIAMRNYIVGDYQTYFYKTVKGDESYMGPKLYKINGYASDGNCAGYGKIYIPELNLEIEAIRDIFPFLSTEEYSTVIYSGNKGFIDRTRGFFVGSNNRKPAKFRKINNSYDVEEFSKLGTASIDELYVDLTKDLTIYPGGVTDMYKSIEFDNWTMSVSETTSDLLISHNTIITGIGSLNISLAKGVTLTLDNISIDGNIACSGNATIIAADNSENHINGSVIAGPKSTKLVIAGNGKTNIKTKADTSPGIGCCENQECGDIYINGGEIHVESDQWSPAIGAANGDFSICGNIYINGGTVYAIGAPYCPAIGCGLMSVCGNITISRNVSHVTVTRGGMCNDAIGKGFGKICGDVIIEDKSKVTSISW